jgi:hypothetical protein
MFVMLDLDVPPQQGSTNRRVLLHALNTGFKATQQKLNGAGTLLASTQKGPAMYVPPGPPATDTVAHRYVQLLFKEPAALNVKASDFANSTGRFNFNIETFMTENKLGAPVAGSSWWMEERIRPLVMATAMEENEQLQRVLVQSLAGLLHSLREQREYARCHTA